MRTAVVTTSYPVQPGSFSGHFVAAEARALQRAGQTVVVCAPGAPGHREIEGVQVATLGSESLFHSPGALPQLSARPYLILEALSFARRARRWLKRNGPVDRVQAHWLIPCAWPIARGLNAPLEVVCHGSDVRLLTGLPRLLQRKVIGDLLAADAVLRCVSHELQDQLLHLDPRVARLTRVKPCPIEITGAPSRAAAREALSIAPGDALILIVARLIPGKRVDVALSALATVLRIQPRLQVAVIGAGPLLHRLKEQFPFARFLGEHSRDKTLIWMAAADGLLSASLQEGAPTVVREARALGVAVICSPAGDVRTWARSDAGIYLSATDEDLPGVVEQVLGRVSF